LEGKAPRYLPAARDLGLEPDGKPIGIPSFAAGDHS
jgi:hypothetical protein